MLGERPGAYRLTVGVKATFTLEHRGQALLASRQDTAHGDVSWDHNPQAALFAPSDYVPLKPRIDVLFSGRAFAPGGTPTEVVTPRIRIGHFEKTLRVCGPRVWMDGPTGLRPSAPEKFVAAPLRYELAAMQGENMSGIPIGSASTGWPLPRIELPDESSPITPGFGPLPVIWRADSRGASEAAVSFARKVRIEPALVPSALDFCLFNSAPIEQQLEELEPAPVIELEHLHRKIPRLETRLPNIRPRAFHIMKGAVKPVEIDLRMDTIWIDGFRMLAVVSWRGSLPVPTYEDHALGRIVVATESPEMTVSLEDVESPPVPPEDSTPRPILPRPFEGEIAEDEGYTLLPLRPVREDQAPAEAPVPEAPAIDAPAGRPSSALPPRPRDSSVPIPPSGERRIEDRDSTVVVNATVPGPSEIVERASLGQFVTPGWESDEPWPEQPSLAAPATPAATSDDLTVREEAALPGAAVEGADDEPRTARAASNSSDEDKPAPETAKNAFDQAPPTLAPSTQKTGSVPPPPMTLATPTPRNAHPTERSTPEPPPATQRAPNRGTSESRGIMSAYDVAPVTSQTPPLFSTGTPVVSAPVTPASSAVSAAVSVEPMRSSAERRRQSSTGLPAVRLSLAELPLELCASLSARIDRCPDERPRILAEIGASDQAFVAADHAWVTAIRAECEQGRFELRASYERAYVQQLEIERGILEPTEYAKLMVSVEYGDADVVLVELGLPRCALVRIERIYQERMGADPSFGMQVRQLMATTRKAFWRTARKGPPNSTDPEGLRTTTYAEAAAPSRPRSSDR